MKTNNEDMIKDDLTIPINSGNTQSKQALDYDRTRFRRAWLHTAFPPDEGEFKHTLIIMLVEYLIWVIWTVTVFHEGNIRILELLVNVTLVKGLIVLPTHLLYDMIRRFNRLDKMVDCKDCLILDDYLEQNQLDKKFDVYVEKTSKTCSLCRLKQAFCFKKQSELKHFS